jgi:hypothetical protein
MAVEDLKSNLYRDPQSGASILDPMLKAGRLIFATGEIAHAADASNLSKYRLCDLPSDCILHPLTYFDVTDLGFAAVRIGTLSDVDALVSQTQATADIITPIANGDANHNKRLWEVLGLAEDPGGVISLYQHAIAGATGAGKIQFQVAYIYN